MAVTMTDTATATTTALTLAVTVLSKNMKISKLRRSIVSVSKKKTGVTWNLALTGSYDNIDSSTYKPRGASPLGQFLLVGPLFLCVEKVR
jgi:hypothetical protein